MWYDFSAVGDETELAVFQSDATRTESCPLFARISSKPKD